MSTGEWADNRAASEYTMTAGLCCRALEFWKSCGCFACVLFLFTNACTRDRASERNANVSLNVVRGRCALWWDAVFFLSCTPLIYFVCAARIFYICCELWPEWKITTAAVSAHCAVGCSAVGWSILIPVKCGGSDCCFSFAPSLTLFLLHWHFDTGLLSAQQLPLHFATIA